MSFDTSPSGVDMAIARDDSRVTSQVVELKDILFQHHTNIPLDNILVLENFNSRRIFDEDGLRGLAKNIQDNGLLQSIILVHAPEDLKQRHPNVLYVLLAGERRYRAMRDYSSMTTCPDSKVYDIAAWDYKKTIMLSENSQREDLTLLELVDDVAKALDEEYAGFENPSRSFIQSGALKETQSRPAVAIANAMKIWPEFRSFLVDTQVQDFRTAQNVANAVIKAESGEIDKRKRDNILNLVRDIRDRRVKIDNLYKATTEIKNWSQGKGRKPNLPSNIPDVVNSSENLDVNSEAVETVNSNVQVKRSVIKAKSLESIRDKLIQLENGEVELEPTVNSDLVNQLISLLKGINLG